MFIFLNLSFIVNETKQSFNEMKQRDITPYNILKKIVPDRKMVGKIARVKIKMVISRVKLSFLFNFEITVFHRYLYNNLHFKCCMTLPGNDSMEVMFIFLDDLETVVTTKKTR